MFDNEAHFSTKYAEHLSFFFFFFSLFFFGEEFIWRNKKFWLMADCFPSRLWTWK